MNIEKVVVIVGPTAVGKSAVSLHLGSLPVEIISGDSMQVYKGMDIGTGKISKQEQRMVPHHLIDIKDPLDSFSAAAFQQKTESLIAEIHQRGNIALHDELAAIDPKHAQTIHPNNYRRVIRALEVYYTTQQTMSTFQEKQQNLKPLYDTFIIGLEMERQKLYDKINRRVETMLE